MKSASIKIPIGLIRLKISIDRIINQATKISDCQNHLCWWRKHQTRHIIIVNRWVKVKLWTIHQLCLCTIRKMAKDYPFNMKNPKYLWLSSVKYRKSSTILAISKRPRLLQWKASLSIKNIKKLWKISNWKDCKNNAESKINWSKFKNHLWSAKSTVEK